jgi:hypothetical protein
MAEALVGDITPHDGISKEEKHKLEEVIITLHISRFAIANIYLSPEHDGKD